VKKKELYPKLQDMPYHNTTVSTQRSRSEILRLLEKYGIDSHLWGTIEGKEAIQFQIQTIVQGAQVKKMVRIECRLVKI